MSNPPATVPVKEKPKLHEKDIEILNKCGISNEKILKIQKIFSDKGWVVAAEEIRKVLRNGEADPYLAATDEIYKNKIRALIVVYGVGIAYGALHIEKKDILRE
jgi:hypothetical protein